MLRQCRVERQRRLRRWSFDLTKARLSNLTATLAWDVTQKETVVSNVTYIDTTDAA